MRILLQKKRRGVDEPFRTARIVHRGVGCLRMAHTLADKYRKENTAFVWRAWPHKIPVLLASKLYVFRKAAEHKPLSTQEHHGP